MERTQHSHSPNRKDETNSPTAPKQDKDFLKKKQQQIRRLNHLCPDIRLRNFIAIDEFDKSAKDIESQFEPRQIEQKIEVDQILRRNGIQTQGKTAHELMLYAASRGLVNVLKFFEVLDINTQSHFGDTMLHFAAKSNHIDTVKYLLLKGANPNVKNKFEETAIFYAAEMGNEEITRCLAKDKRTNLEDQDKFGDTLLHFAARDGQHRICELVCSIKKSVVKIKNQEGKNPVNCAIEAGHAQCVDVLKSYDGEPNILQRQNEMMELINKLVNEPPDYKKSIVKHKVSKAYE